jgi:hypothetical protein
MNADALRLEIVGVEMHHLAAIGAPPGVAAIMPGGRNGPGTGSIRTSGDGNVLAWKAPGSDAYGQEVTCEADGDYVLCDGGDVDKFVRVQVWRAWLTRPGDFSVHLRDVYNNPVSLDDVTAEEAAAGLVDVWTIDLRNAGEAPLANVRMWLDPAGDPNMALSFNGADWSQPTTESEGLAIGALMAPGITTPVYLRRTVSAGAASTPKRLVHFHCSFDSVL